MELKRSNLVLPTSGYELDREEMSYVEGGAISTYRGFEAVLEITDMIANVVGWAGLSSKLITAALASAAASGGWAVVASVLLALGGAASIAMAGVNLCTAVMAIGFFIADNGFKVESYSVFGFGLYLVKRL
jgi:hypothetical protein